MAIETNVERLETFARDIDGNILEIIEVLQQSEDLAERVQELERQNMRYRRALKHITVFPTNFSHEYHSKRALKIARKILKGASE